MATMRGEGIVTWHCRDCTAPSFVGDHSSISIPEMESTRLEVKKFEIIRKVIELIKLVGLLKKVNNFKLGSNCTDCNSRVDGR